MDGPILWDAQRLAYVNTAGEAAVSYTLVLCVFSSFKPVSITDNVPRSPEVRLKDWNEV
jgi:hypothetical protein